MYRYDDKLELGESFENAVMVSEPVKESSSCRSTSECIQTYWLPVIYNSSVKCP